MVWALVRTLHLYDDDDEHYESRRRRSLFEDLPVIGWIKKSRFVSIEK